MTTSGYTLLDIPRPRQGLVHVHAGSDELGRVYQADLPINASQRAFLEAVAAMEPVDSSAWSPYTPQAHREYERSEEHTSELQSLMRISYAVFCLKKKKNKLKQQQIST